MKKQLVDIESIEEAVKRGVTIICCKRDKSSRIKKKAKKTVNVMSLYKKCNAEQKKKLIKSLKESGIDFDETAEE